MYPFLVTVSETSDTCYFMTAQLNGPKIREGVLLYGIYMHAKVFYASSNGSAFTCTPSWLKCLNNQTLITLCPLSRIIYNFVIVDCCMVFTYLRSRLTHCLIVLFLQVVLLPESV
jgi:hypothetical protein